MNRNKITAAFALLALCLVLPFDANGKGKGLSGYSIFVESTPVIKEADNDPNKKAHEHRQDDFSIYLKPALMKWKVPLRIVTGPAKADMVLDSSGTSRARRWHEGILTHRGETSRAAVEVVDRCGNLLWSMAAGDRSLRMDVLVGPFAKSGPRKVADRIIKRFKSALKSGKVVAPCKPD